MRKPNASSPTATPGAAPQATEAQTAPADTASSATSVAGAPQAAPASPAPEAADEHQGQGGLYSVVDGKRVLVHRTQSDQTAG